MKIKYTHTAAIASIILMSGCVTYPKNYTYSPTVTTESNSEVTLPSPFATRPQQIPSRHVVYNTYMPPQQVEYTHYRVPRYPDYPPYRNDSQPLYYENY